MPWIAFSLLFLGLIACGQNKGKDSNAKSAVQAGTTAGETKMLAGLPGESFTGTNTAAARQALISLLAEYSISDVIVPPCSYAQSGLVAAARDPAQCKSKDFTGVNLLQEDRDFSMHGTVPEGTANSPAQTAETDRWEIKFNRRVEHIYGLGSSPDIGSSQVPDFLDIRFARGHLMYEGMEMANSDMLRMRTPIFVMPELNLIIAFPTLDVKIIRLTRTADSTTLVVKRKPEYTFGNNVKVVMVFGKDNDDMYRRYHDWLKSRGFPLKKPVYQAFGVNWEIFDETGIFPDLKKIDYARKQFEQGGINLRSLTIGSGFWSYDRGNNQRSLPYFEPACKFGSKDCPNNLANDAPYDCSLAPGKAQDTFCVAAAMEMFEQNPRLEIVTDDGVKRDLKSYFGFLKDKGIFPMIGMRHNMRAEYALEYANKLISFSGGQLKSPDQVFFGSKFPAGSGYPDSKYYGYHGLGNVIAALDITNPAVMDAYMKGIQGAYGPIMGIKEDEMYWPEQQLGVEDYQQGFGARYSKDKFVHPGKNLPDGFFSHAYGHWAKQNGGDFIIYGSNPYFSHSVDAEVGMDWNPAVTQDGLWGQNQAYLEDLGYPGVFMSKFGLDNHFAKVASGFVHPYYAVGYPSRFDRDDPRTECAIAPIPDDDPATPDPSQEVINAYLKKFMRDQQLRTFMPVDVQSCGFWHLKNTAAEGFAPRDAALAEKLHAATLYYIQLRQRLAHYAFDMAMEWYDTGVPTLMKPLFLQPGVSGLGGVHEMYRRTKVFEVEKTSPGNLFKMSYEKCDAAGKCGLVKQVKACKHKDGRDGCTPPQDFATKPMNEFMFGNAMLVRPVLTVQDVGMQVLLPPGAWRSLITDQVFVSSPENLVHAFTSDETRLFEYPAFVKEGQLLLMSLNEKQEANLEALVFFEGNGPAKSEEYRFRNQLDGSVGMRLTAERLADGQVFLVNSLNGCRAAMATKYGKSFMRAEISKLADAATCVH